MHNWFSIASWRPITGQNNNDFDVNRIKGITTMMQLLVKSTNVNGDSMNVNGDSINVELFW